MFYCSGSLCSQHAGIRNWRLGVRACWTKLPRKCNSPGLKGMSSLKGRKNIESIMQFDRDNYQAMYSPDWDGCTVKYGKHASLIIYRCLTLSTFHCSWCFGKLTCDFWHTNLKTCHLIFHFTPSIPNTQLSFCQFWRRQSQDSLSVKDSPLRFIRQHPPEQRNACLGQAIGWLLSMWILGPLAAGTCPQAPCLPLSSLHTKNLASVRCTRSKLRA